MNDNNPLDYKEYYKSILTIKNESSEKASKFLHLFSDLIVKYSSQIEENNIEESGE